MNELTERIIKTYAPRLAIIAYSTDDKFNDCYLESHVMAAGKVLAGKPLKQETIEGIVDIFYSEQQSKSKIQGFIPENLLLFLSTPGGKYKMVWYRPEQRRFLNFDANLKITSGEAWVPATVWATDGKDLNIYALKGLKRPDPETPLFRAPFHNVDDAGNVCLGSAKVAKPTDKTYLSMMKYWEDLFWLSIFTHLSGDCPTRTNVNMLWKKLIKDPKMKWGPLDQLLPTEDNYKLKDILK